MELGGVGIAEGRETTEYKGSAGRITRANLTNQKIYLETIVFLD